MRAVSFHNPDRQHKAERGAAWFDRGHWAELVNGGERATSGVGEPAS